MQIQTPDRHVFVTDTGWDSTVTPLNPPATSRAEETMRLQRQVKHRLVPIQHAHGLPIVKPLPPAELVKAWRKAKKKRARAGAPA